jgi:hypothetical protein
MAKGRGANLHYGRRTAYRRCAIRRGLCHGQTRLSKQMMLDTVMYAPLLELVSVPLFG